MTLDVRHVASLKVEECERHTALSPELATLVETVWQEECARRGSSLYDGELFSIAEITKNGFRGHFVPYRDWLAQTKRPGARAELGIRPLAVSGLVRLAEGVVFGRRAETVTQDPGCWELAPSGGIGPACRVPGGLIDVEAQLRSELDEELGVSPRHITSLALLGVVIDDSSGVVDVCYRIELDVGQEALCSAFTTRASSEYGEIRVVDAQALPSFLAEADAALSPVSRKLLGVAGLID